MEKGSVRGNDDVIGSNWLFIEFCFIDGVNFTSMELGGDFMGDGFEFR